MILLIIAYISTILYIIAGIIGTTKWSIRVKVKLGLESICLIANILWCIDCFYNPSPYLWVGLLYIILGIIGVINFTRINIKNKKNLDVCTQLCGDNSPTRGTNKDTVFREDKTD